MVKVLSTLLCLPGFETQIQNDKTGKRSAPKRRSTREQREGQGEGPRTVETWFVSGRHYELRTEVLEGAHSKYRSCRRLVSLIQDCISRCPYEVPVDREGVPKQFHFRHMVYLVWFVVHLVE